MKTLAAIAAVAVLATASSANAVVVDALVHSSNSGAGAGLATISLTAGQVFSVSADPGDLWNAGALPRWSNADGLVADLYATGSDDSGEAAGTLIGSDFGLVNIDGFSAPYGALVGQIGSGPGSYRLLGTSFNGAAWDTGVLKLYYWDTFTADNTQSIDVSIAGVPEPGAWALMITGMGLAGSALRRRRRLQIA